MSTRSEKGEELFKDGYNCAQAVVMAFDDILPAESRNLAGLASPFGGGMGLLREVCGAFSGSLIVLGLLRGAADPKDRTGRRVVYEDVRRLADRFVKEHGSLICAELLGLRATPENVHVCKSPCSQMVAGAILAMEDVLEEETDANSAGERCDGVR